MVPDAPRRPRMQHVTTAGAALAVTLGPLVIGVLLAKTMAVDPMSPVNALVTRGGQPVLPSPAQWRGCGTRALHSWRGGLDVHRRPAVPATRRLRVRPPRRAGRSVSEP
ncbi:hypothetical protein [Streptomyces sp. NPDC056061]|uniref:hypothetical protein n=1 Tax=Streptomyces sp. NPDC056061 TaxID=3345700 RepID=UPI0035D80911